MSRNGKLNSIFVGNGFQKVWGHWPIAYLVFRSNDSFSCSPRYSLSRVARLPLPAHIVSLTRDVRDGPSGECLVDSIYEH